MIWAAIASNGKKSSIFIIPHDVKINKDVHLEFLKDKVMPWIQEEFHEDAVFFTQDSAPANSAKLVQSRC
ncbi:Putative dde superfamily endonuclease [Caligus rogercresseyi]|uniref:Dde superfamily endonuclease n=1 Tax=Caligus rogercresseyi TaxID=217165 RepID=A0A7T8GW29_CALRO|nr:Putative dde superfamily endonuclease [Caligus rogercresseyi]